MKNLPHSQRKTTTRKKKIIQQHPGWVKHMYTSICIYLMKPRSETQNTNRQKQRKKNFFNILIKLRKKLKKIQNSFIKTKHQLRGVPDSSKNSVM